MYRIRNGKGCKGKASLICLHSIMELNFYNSTECFWSLSTIRFNLKQVKTQSLCRYLLDIQVILNTLHDLSQDCNTFTQHQPCIMVNVLFVTRNVFCGSRMPETYKQNTRTKQRRYVLDFRNTLRNLTSNVRFMLRALTSSPYINSITFQFV